MTLHHEETSSHGTKSRAIACPSRVAARAVAPAFLVLMTTLPLVTARAANPLAATSSNAAREEAIQAIPWSSLSHQQARAVRNVTRKSSFYRRLPTQIIECDPQLFTFLIQHPDVIADTWQVMGVSQLKVERAGQRTFFAEDGLGTTGKFSYLETTWSETAFNRALIFARGSFEGKPLTQAIDANCVLLLRSGSFEEQNGRTYITVRMDTFLDFDHAGVDLIAKTVTPLVNKVADHNFTETLRFVSNFSRAAERNPDGLQRFSEKLTKLEPATRDELVVLCRSAAERYSSRLQQQSEVTPTVATEPTTAAVQ
jgi:hypothetical protein